MVDIMNFVFLLVCIIILSIRLMIARGRISKLEGQVSALVIILKRKSGCNNE